jgi:hypothetical protein
LFAFGAAGPQAGKLQAHNDRTLPNIFQQSQWFYVPLTEGTGVGTNDVVLHDIVLPVQYINDWLQEATWTRITTVGRRNGRPNYNGAVILRHTATRMASARKSAPYGNIDNWDCRIETYNHAGQVANGGLMDLVILPTVP